MIEKYIEELTQIVYEKISDYLLTQKDEELIYDHFILRMKVEQFANFQVYYFSSLNKPDEMKFIEFKQKYSLQGVDSNYIKLLQNKKDDIVKLISANKLSELYFTYFAKAKIKHKDTFVEKNLGSFFTKIVHTFKPDDYTPLDIPIRNYFRLDDESYFVSLIVVSNAYKLWADRNRQRITNMKNILDKTEYKFLRQENVTDLKLLNLIFWSVADKEKK